MRWPCLSNQSLERLLQTSLFHRCNWNQRKYAFTYKIRSPPLEKHKFLVIVRIVRFAAPKDLFYSCLGRSEVGHGRMFAKTAHLTSFGLPKAQLSANNVQFTIFSKLSISLCVTRGAPDEVEKWHTELCCCRFRTSPNGTFRAQKEVQLEKWIKNNRLMNRSSNVIRVSILLFYRWTFNFAQSPVTQMYK